MFLAFIFIQGGNVVHACESLDVEDIRCNAHCLNSSALWGLGMAGTANTCQNKLMGGAMKRQWAFAGVLSLSPASNDELKDMQELQTEFHRGYELIGRNDKRYDKRHCWLYCGNIFFSFKLSVFWLLFFFFFPWSFVLPCLRRHVFWRTAVHTVLRGVL